ncbi:hypothetical protein [Bacteroides sp.]|nr:hypothetical protein [Bacteroides sp.]
MRKYFFFRILLLLPIISIAQTYKYIGVNRIRTFNDNERKGRER